MTGSLVDGIVDTMIGFPTDPDQLYATMRRQLLRDFANTRGADRLIYGGYFPMGLSLERIMEELPTVPLKDDVWRGFLRDNARRVLRLGGDA